MVRVDNPNASESWFKIARFRRHFWNSPKWTSGIPLSIIINHTWMSQRTRKLGLGLGLEIWTRRILWFSNLSNRQMLRVTLDLLENVNTSKSRNCQCLFPCFLWKSQKQDSGNEETQKIRIANLDSSWNLRLGDFNISGNFFSNMNLKVRKYSNSKRQGWIWWLGCPSLLTSVPGSC